MWKNPHRRGKLGVAGVGSAVDISGTHIANLRYDVVIRALSWGEWEPWELLDTNSEFPRAICAMRVSPSPANGAVISTPSRCP
jgi:hypothetical protein